MEFNKINLRVERSTLQIHFVFKKYNKEYATLTFNFSNEADLDRIFQQLNRLLEVMGDKMHYKEW